MNAESNAESTVKASTTSGRQPDDDRSDPDGSDAVSDIERAPGPDAESVVRPEPRPPESTRQFTDVSDDDRDGGWGETTSTSGRDDDWYLRERPPHHG